MFRKIEDFLTTWEHESQVTQKLFDALTDASLAQPVARDHRTLGRMAWHIAATIPEMMGLTGLKLAGPAPQDGVPAQATKIRQAFHDASRSLAEQIKSNWSDESLTVTDPMYGETWARGSTLFGLVTHQCHHRGQMTVLMRQAGLKVPGVYGPSYEEWAGYGAEPPAI